MSSCSSVCSPSDVLGLSSTIDSHDALTLTPFDPHWSESYYAAATGRSSGTAAAVSKSVPSNNSSSNISLPLLFTPKELGPLTLKNRIIVSPMCQYSSQPSGPEKGYFNDWHLVELGRYALGGAALIFTEASAVEARGRISPWCAGLWSDDHIPGLRRIGQFIHAQGSLLGVQLAHAGRKASTNPPWIAAVDGNLSTDAKHHGWTGDVVGPSAIPWGTNYPNPHPLTKEEIKHIVQLFADATVRADKAGADALEIHAAHGYLLSSFLSPLSNNRTDEYGGSFENRIRILVEVIDAVREKWPKTKILSLRVSCSEWVEGGWGVEDSVRLAEIVSTHGIDLFDATSGGNNSAQKIIAGPGYQVPFAKAVKIALGNKTTSIMDVGAVGILVDGKQAEEILETGKADWIFVGREFLRDPNFPLHAAQQMGVDIHWPAQFEWAVRGRIKRNSTVNAHKTAAQTGNDHATPTATTTVTKSSSSDGTSRHTGTSSLVPTSYVSIP